MIGSTARSARRGVAALACAMAFGIGAPPARAQDAAALKARHAELRESLAHNVFGRPLHLESTQNSGDLKGEVYAVVEQPFATVGPALQGIDHWCDILILHLNVKFCSPSAQRPAGGLTLVVGRKFDQPIDDAYRVEFDYRLAAATPDYLRVQLNADEGPLGTRNYRIVLEAVPLDGRQSFLHMSYSYAYGFAARMAMETYLATVGRDKVGFSITGQKDGKPVHVGNVRGVVERNTMRYFLAIESFLAAYELPPAAQLAKRLDDWFDGSERYPLQLHEIERNDYLQMKRREVARQKDERKLP